MATRFELVLVGEDTAWLRAVGEEALEEIRRLDRVLSAYRPGSDVGRSNRLASDEPVRVLPEVFDLLQASMRLSRLTAGAFDITVGPLMRAWGLFGGKGEMPEDRVLDEARSVTGMELVELDPDAGTIRYAVPGVQIDLGGVGKGYAVDRAAEILREAGVQDAFLHGGTSTIFASGQDRSGPWKVAIPAPLEDSEAEDEALLDVVALRDEAMAVSSQAGKSFEAEGRVLGHVMDPRLGTPVEGALLAAVTSTSAMAADALSTAALVLGAEAPSVLEAIPEARRFVVAIPSEDQQYRLIGKGIFRGPAVADVSLS
jgi:thiamine biosynthesis lipoprotein